MIETEQQSSLARAALIKTGQQKMNQPDGSSRAGVAALALLLAITGCATHSPRPDNGALTAPATFNSKLAFAVMASIEPLQGITGWTNLGTTPAPEPIQIPACYAWELSPDDKTTFQQTIAEAVAAQAPGVASSFWAPVSNADLTVLKQKLPGIRLLDIWESPKVTDAGLAGLKDFKNLRILGLQHCGEITDAGIARLKDIPQLQFLALGYCDKITTAGLASLKDIKILQGLELNGDNINDDALAVLKDIRGLKGLDLSWCDKITDAGLARLEGLKSLRVLNLAKTQISDAGLAHLKGLTALQSLNLRACPQITAAAVAGLRQALPAAKIDY